MNKFFLFVLLLSYGIIFAQYSKNNPTSVVIPPPNYSPTGTNSTIYTVDGFDNFYLGGDFGEPYIAVNPTDPKNQVCAYNTNSFYYTLNGIDWIRGYPAFSGFPILGDPVMTFDSLGNIYYAQLYNLTASGTYGIAVAKSTNKGVSWISYVSAASTIVGLSDKEWIASDQTGFIYIGWRQFGSSGMRFVRSTNGGVSYSTPITLTGDQGAYISVGANGNISGGYVYYACTSSNNIAFYRSSNGGASFQSLGNAVSGIAGPGTQYNGRWTMKTAKIRTDYFPRMAADNSYSSTRGNVYITYAANPPGSDLADVFMIKSTNNGVNWSVPVRVNDDATTCDQWMPTISVDKNTGKIFISFYDSRNDPNNIMTEVYGATSTNGGASFTNSKISNASFNPNVMAVPQSQGDAYYMGDYIGTASTMNGVTSITSWMDDRTNVQSNMMSFVGYNPDFALTVNTSQVSLANNDSTTLTFKVPGIKGIFNDRIKFTYSLDTLPVSGTISISFVNGKDSITTYPDSLFVKVKTIGNILPSKN
ncbi:MAG: sialidase family protein, partial [Ignavibacteriae bacterium]|nr:sialidase family protein [Ignavibacteriota bacterium]